MDRVPIIRISSLPRGSRVSEYTLAITGASGSLCGVRLLRELSMNPGVERVNVVASRGSLG